MASHSKLSNEDKKELLNPRQDALLPLVPVAPSALTSTNSVSFSLLSDPTDNDSPKCKVTQRIINGSETIRTFLDWMKETVKILAGLNLTQDNQYDQTVRIAQGMLRGRALSVFNQQLKMLLIIRMNARADAACTAAAGDAAAKRTAKEAILNAGRDNASNKQFVQIGRAIQGTMQALMPKKVLARCKRHLRRHCRKPREMKVREYVHYILQMNEEEFPRLPPFGIHQKLPEDEILDIVLFGTPKSWEREMDKQSFDPFSVDLATTVAKMEDIETAEAFDNDPNKKTVSKKPSKKSHKNESSSGSNNGKKYCIWHGQGSHNTEDCETLKKQIKRLKNNGSNDSHKGSSGNKSGDWKKKANDAKTKAKDQFATFITETVDKAVKKAAVSQKKRKSNDDSSEGTIAAYERLDIEDFDYTQMENLVIGGDDEDEASC